MDDSPWCGKLQQPFLLCCSGKTALECEESWAGPSLCTIDIQGLSAQEGGFQAYCAAAECRV